MSNPVRLENSTEWKSAFRDPLAVFHTSGKSLKIPCFTCKDSLVDHVQLVMQLNLSCSGALTMWGGSGSTGRGELFFLTNL